MATVVYVEVVSVQTASVTALNSWCDAITQLDDGALLQTRVVIVPMEAHAHALRRALVERASRYACGTRFLTMPAAARAVLDGAAVAYRTGEEWKRVLRVNAAFRRGVALESYRGDELVKGGWGEAFASTIEQLELAGLRPHDLRATNEPRARDLATVWDAVDGEAAASWTAARIVAEAALHLEADPTAWPFDGAVLAYVTAGISAIEARFVRAIPGAVHGMNLARPMPSRLTARLQSWFSLPPSSPRAAPAGELAILREYLFADAEVLASPDRARSSGPDGSVTLETFAGVAEELDAAVTWVATEVHERRTPLQDIAILAPSAEPHVQWIADRLAELQPAPPVYAPSGLPTAAGTRLLAVVRALRAHLAREALLGILPFLRCEGDDRRLSPRRCRAAVLLLGAPGGSDENPRGALGWARRLPVLAADERLRGAVPALQALVNVAGTVLSHAPLSDVWDQLERFATGHLAGRFDDLTSSLRTRVHELAADPAGAAVTGALALELVDDHIRAVRPVDGRYGEGRIYVGTLASAAGLPFTAVRVIGLSEGQFPGTMLQDALLPRDIAASLPAYSRATQHEYAASRLQLLHRILRDTRARVSLSAPLSDAGGSEREPAGWFVEVAAALARPHAVTGLRGPVIPSLADLERDYFVPARALRVTALPLRPRDTLFRVASRRGDLPAGWNAVVAIRPADVASRADSYDHPIGPTPLSRLVPGLTPESSISATSLQTLLRCPRQFLFERVLVQFPRESLPSMHRIDPMFYGSILHRVVQRFLDRHGDAFAARRETLAHWQDLARAIAEEVFTLQCEAYPLATAAARDLEWQRARLDVAHLLESEWTRLSPTRFVATEREFDAVPVATAAGSLFLHGRVDRIDVEAGATLVRDLKTGMARPRERDAVDPDVQIDLQLAVYEAVARRLATAWGLPERVAVAYSYIDRKHEAVERSFRHDVETLRRAGDGWLELASGLLRGNHFVPSPRGEDCSRCAFGPACGRAHAASADALATTAVPVLASFGALKS